MLDDGCKRFLLALAPYGRPRVAVFFTAFNSINGLSWLHEEIGPNRPAKLSGATVVSWCPYVRRAAPGAAYR